MAAVEIVRASSYAAGMNQPQTDDELYEQFRSGGQAAYDRLYRRHAGNLQAFIAARFRPPLDAEEIAHIAWINAWKAREDFDGRNFCGWLFRIARNAAIDQQRKLRDETPLGEMDPAHVDSQNPMAQLVLDEETQALRDCLSSIDQKFANILRLKFFEDLKDKEIADRLDVPMGTVASGANRGRKQLKDCLETRRMPK